jgi:integrase
VARRKSLTDNMVAQLKPGAKRITISDPELRGHFVRVTPSGAKSYCAVTRNPHGKQVWATLGSADHLTIDEARNRAREAIKRVKDGLPAFEPPPVAPDSFEAIVNDFIERHAKKHNKRWGERERIFRVYVTPRWGQRPINGITRRDVIELLDRINDERGPIMANRVHGAVRKLFNWCLDRDILEVTPVARVKAPGKEVERDRVLSDNEIKALWEGCNEMGWVFGPFIQMLLATAQRRDEVAHMRWDHIDIDCKVWTLPRELTKADRSHEVPLSPLTLEILEGLPRTGPFVFSTIGDRPISGFAHAKERADRSSGVSDWWLHDLRRTVGTNMARSGIAVSTISRVLNHKEGGVTKIYARYSYLDEKRHALDTWGRRLESLIRPTDDNVVPMMEVVE